MKTTDKHFQYFKERCEYWLNHFHLGYWKVTYSHMDLGDTCFAQNSAQTNNFSAEIRLNKDWSNKVGIEVTEEKLDETAKHEILHVLCKLPEEELVVRLSRLL